MHHLNYLEINKENLLHNLSMFKKISSAKIAAVVKGNAYGHGLKEICQILDGQVDYFQVDDYEELVELRKYTQTKALVLGYVSLEKINLLIKLNAIPGLYNLNIINRYHGKYHLKIDTFLGRQGILTSNLEQFLTKIENRQLDGAYTHFSGLDDVSNLKHYKKQLRDFKKALRVIKSHGFRLKDVHSNATAGLLINHGVHTTINRLGAGLYGMWPSESIKNRYEKRLGPLKPVLTWISHVAQVKVLPKGYPIGYGQTFITPRKMKVAVIPQGYSDGYDRKLSNKGSVLIHRQLCRVLGRISMNMFVADVDNLENVKADDQVILVGNDLNERISVENLAEKTETINYEITSRISSNLPRIIKNK